MLCRPRLHLVRFQVLTAANMAMAIFWVAAPRSPTEAYRRFRGAVIAVMMEVASISETSIKFYQTTQRSNSDDRHLNNTRRRENYRGLIFRQRLFHVPVHLICLLFKHPKKYKQGVKIMKLLIMHSASVFYYFSPRFISFPHCSVFMFMPFSHAYTDPLSPLCTLVLSFFTVGLHGKVSASETVHYTRVASFLFCLTSCVLHGRGSVSSGSFRIFLLITSYRTAARGTKPTQRLPGLKRPGDRSLSHNMCV
jgi:hypothetical protein